MKILNQMIYNALRNDKINFLLHPFTIVATKWEEWQSGINMKDIKRVKNVSKKIEGNSYGEKYNVRKEK